MTGKTMFVQSVVKDLRDVGKPTEGLDVLFYSAITFYDHAGDTPLCFVGTNFQNADILILFARSDKDTSESPWARAFRDWTPENSCGKQHQTPEDSGGKEEETPENGAQHGKKKKKSKSLFNKIEQLIPSKSSSSSSGGSSSCNSSSSGGGGGSSSSGGAEDSSRSDGCGEDSSSSSSSSSSGGGEGSSSSSGGSNSSSSSVGPDDSSLAQASSSSSADDRPWLPIWSAWCQQTTRTFKVVVQTIIDDRPSNPRPGRPFYPPPVKEGAPLVRPPVKKSTPFANYGDSGYHCTLRMRSGDPNDVDNEAIFITFSKILAKFNEWRYAKPNYTRECSIDSDGEDGEDGEDG
eukprot:CAMPEP_0177664870 /NCGR_PEP_ID=MMETSP0447-20121125/20745_1 /TAXON_ID=0 /ORGANISM="Stygamoeba regulata, Strain BSH-02190019" /LENGTH=347 /DNA_ID=CAMNT_0019170913 /DNA_START=412 /DNA_END=1453 /DNA_ORIENTATION=+